MRHTMTAARLFASLALAALASVFSAPRCQGDDVLFSDDFKTADPAWAADANGVIKDGTFTVQPELNMGDTYVNQANVFQDMTCSIKMQKLAGDADEAGGLAFWAADYSNCYYLNITAEGKVGVCRKVSGRWLYPLNYQDCADIKKGTGQWNVLKVVVRGNQATVSVNGKNVATFKGQPPDGGGMVGMYGESGATTKSQWQFSDLSVTK